MLKQFFRVTSGRFIPAIDGLRFLAILPVVLMHTATSFKKNSAWYDQGELQGRSLLNDLLNTGSLGVYFFFVISGFILALPFARQHLYDGSKVSLGRYFRKRLTRLEPPYLITLTLLFLGHIAMGTAALEQLTRHYAAGFFYLHNPLFGTWSPINPVAWTLEIEVQFYILVPVLTLVFAIKDPFRRRGLLLLAIVLFTWLNYVWPYAIPFGLLPKYLHFFLTGFFLTDLYLDPREIKLSARWVDLAGLIAVAGIFAIEYTKLRFGYPLAFSLIFLAAFRGFWVKRFFTTSWVVVIGGMCYITYLLHFPLAFVLTKMTNGLATGAAYEWDVLLQLGLVVPLIFTLCAAAFLVLEKPFMYYNWPEQLKRRIKTIFTPA